MTKLKGGLSRLHSADEDAVSWLTNYGLWHAYEKKKNLQSCRVSLFVVLIYEPDNAEALNFQPVIEEKLALG